MNRVAILLGCTLLAAAGCDGRVTESQPAQPSVDALLRQSITQWGVIPIGEMPPQNPALVALGRALFFDKVLSGNRDISCSTCHQPDKGLGDGRSLPVGTGATVHGSARALGPGRNFVPRQSPTLLNAGLGMFYMFWDGRLRSNGMGGSFLAQGPILPTGLNHTLIAQAMLPVLNRQEMRGNSGDVDVFGAPNELAQFTDSQAPAIWAALMKRLTAIPEYVDLFAVAFPGRPISQLGFQDAAQAIATFQMQAFTKVRSPFDRYLDRDDAALTAEQKRGAALFFGQEARCAQCHGGPFLGGQNFANVGIPQIGPGVGKQLPLDLGRAEFENGPSFSFRAAPLRNVELTAPYMHNGAFATLEDVVNHYNDVTTSLRTYDASQLDPAVRALYHSDQATVNTILNTVDPRIRQRLNLTDDEKRELVAFLKSLTDPSARDLVGLVPARVPSGLPVQ